MLRQFNEALEAERIEKERMVTGFEQQMNELNKVTVSLGFTKLCNIWCTRRVVITYLWSVSYMASCADCSVATINCDGACLTMHANQILI